MPFNTSRVSSRFSKKVVRAVKFLDTMDNILPRNEMIQAINKVRKEENST
jgi:hypothetical protein